MLYGKIYLDHDPTEGDILVFVSLAVEGAEASRAETVDYIAISPEARESLLLKLNHPDRRMMHYSGSFELFGDDDGDHGVFRFRESEVKGGLRYRTLKESEPISVKVFRGCRRSVLTYMVPCDNATLKELDLSERIDENILWERYYAVMRGRGETPACDTESIKRTPPAFLTEEQKDVIRRDYREKYDGFTEADKRYHADIVDERILRELRQTYAKHAFVIEQILRPTGDTQKS